MTRILLVFLILIPMTSNASEVFRCEEPKGISTWSLNGHQITPDKYGGVHPVVIVDGDTMTIVWGDSKSAGGKEKVWKAKIFYHDSETISAVALDANNTGSASMLYTIDKERGYLYLSSHKQSVLLDSSGVASFISKCPK